MCIYQGLMKVFKFIIASIITVGVYLIMIRVFEEYTIVTVSPVVILVLLNWLATYINFDKLDGQKLTHSVLVFLGSPLFVNAQILVLMMIILGIIKILRLKMRFP